MEKNRNISVASLSKSLFFAAFCTIILVSCSSKVTHDQIFDKEFDGIRLLPAPDYSDSRMWYENLHDKNGNDADIFYICSTETTDWTDDATGQTFHFADITRNEHRSALLSEMAGVDSLIATGCNFYSPYYRQVTIDGLLADTINFKSRSFAAFQDVEHAFNYFLKHKNNNRPFILMGYSQGGFCVLELLKRMTADVAKRMVAAYIIGYKVTADDLKYLYIKPATGATDIGVTICYNSVDSPDAEIPLLSRGSVIGINPANWHTNATPATLCDTLTATLDTVTNLVCISGYKGKVNKIPYIGRNGNYHTLEIPFYSRVLSQNITDRINAWQRLHLQHK